jgi:hypothetical protein
MATAAELITNFELQVSDITELSTSEELVILNRIYQRVCNDRPWEFLKTTATGTILSDADGSYISLPSDFAYFYENYTYTDNALSTEINMGNRVIYIGSSYSPYRIVNYSDRVQYRGRSGYAYVDIANGKLRLPATTTGTYTIDYIKFPATLVAASTPVIPTRFQEVLIYGMAVENEIVQVSDKAKSYAAENQALYEQYIADMALWNSYLLNN